MENASQTESVTDQNWRTGKVARADSGVVEIIPGCMRCLIARKDPRCSSVHHHELILSAWGKARVGVVAILGQPCRSSLWTGFFSGSSSGRKLHPGNSIQERIPG